MLFFGRLCWTAFGPPCLPKPTGLKGKAPRVVRRPFRVPARVYALPYSIAADISTFHQSGHRLQHRREPPSQPTTNGLQQPAATLGSRGLGGSVTASHRHRDAMKMPSSYRHDDAVKLQPSRGRDRTRYHTLMGAIQTIALLSKPRPAHLYLRAVSSPPNRQNATWRFGARIRQNAKSFPHAIITIWRSETR